MPTSYREEFERVARSAFSMWNRDPGSPSFGSFDRAYWGWKYKDFGDATMQYAVRLAIEYARLKGYEAQLPALLAAFVRHVQAIQHADGSFDQAYPNERTPGVVYDLLSTFIVVRNCGLLDAASAATLEGTIDRAAAYALRADERHGEIANHLAQYAYELLLHAQQFGDERTRQRGMKYLERLLTLFDRQEGWFIEYDGPDPGYQTRTLRYLAKIAALRESPELWATLGRAIEFLEALTMPDGTVHPMLGVRSTALVYPSAIELAAARDARHAALAARVRDAWREGRVPLPSAIDFGNAIRLADDALDAARLLASQGAAAERAPIDAEPASGDLPNAGICIRRRGDCVSYVAWKLGGVLVVYARDARGVWRLRDEQAGYLIELGASARFLVSRMQGAGIATTASEHHLEVRVEFQESLHDEMTPFRLLILRLLNLTLLRWQGLGDLFRRIVVRRLVSARRRAGVELHRKIEWTDAAVVVSDRIVDARAARSGGERLLRCRRLSGVHMASARYFQEQELEGDRPWTEPLPWAPGSSHQYEVRIECRN